VQPTIKQMQRISNSQDSASLQLYCVGAVEPILNLLVDLYLLQFTRFYKYFFLKKIIGFP
jgi:hypothetical protein